MTKVRALLFLAALGALAVGVLPPTNRVAAQDSATPAAQDTPIPTVSLVQATPVSIPTLSIPQPAPAVHKKHPKKGLHKAKPVKKAPVIQGNWIWAYLTSYCPGSAGWISATGQTVYYGMLANNFYAFGTHVYLPVLNLTGRVEDRMASYAAWDQFDVWSPSCYSTPTGWYRVAVQG